MSNYQMFPGKEEGIDYTSRVIISVTDENKLISQEIERVKNLKPHFP